MKTHEITFKSAKKSRKRIGRGKAGKGGKTAGRGTKGQRSRTSSGNLPIGFEGGQMPLKQRIPKHKGFYNRFTKKYQIVNLGKIAEILGNNKKIGKEELFKAKLIKDKNEPVKILADGQFKNNIEIEADAFSKSAQKKIKQQDGKAILISENNLSKKSRK